MDNANKKNTELFLPKITKLGKAKDLISLLPEVENKNSNSATDDFSVFTIT